VEVDREAASRHALPRRGSLIGGSTELVVDGDAPSGAFACC